MIILYGGSFDPVHVGHAIVANEIYNAYQPDRFIFMPAKQSPLKTHGTIASDDARVKMLQLTISELGFGEVSTLEIDRTGKSYTFDTVQSLRQLDEEIMIVIGTDQYLQLDRWYKIDELRQLAQFVVVNRDTDILPEENIKSVHVPRVDISSTVLRERLARDETVKFWLLDDVIAFIRKERIYEKEESTEIR